MAFKFVVLAALVAVANAGILGAPAAYHTAPLAYATLPYARAAPLPYSAPAYAHAAPLAYGAPVPRTVIIAPAIARNVVAAPAVARTVIVDTDCDQNPQSSYSYAIQDALTGDSKGQTETRNGDVVQRSPFRKCEICFGK